MSILEGHVCAPSDDPRHAHACRKCGRVIPQPRLRNIEYEREITREAARGAVDATPLIEHAEGRASQQHGYGDVRHVRPGVDWLHEARAELADGRNYLVWLLEENPTSEKSQDVFFALRFLTLAYDRLLEDVE